MSQVPMLWRGAKESSSPAASFFTPLWRVGSCAVERCTNCSRSAYHSFTSCATKLNTRSASMKIPAPWFRFVGCPFASKASAVMKMPSLQRSAMDSIACIARLLNGRTTMRYASWRAVTPTTTPTWLHEWSDAGKKPNTRPRGRHGFGRGFMERAAVQAHRARAVVSAGARFVQTAIRVQKMERVGLQGSFPRAL